MDVLWVLLFGHILGDYFVQTHEMASNKWKPGADGLWWCLFHCATYTVAVVLMLAMYGVSMSFLLGLLIFWTHFPIDRYGVGARIMELKGGSDISNPFYSVIYVAIDNTLHVALMYGVLYIMGLI